MKNINRAQLALNQTPAQSANTVLQTMVVIAMIVAAILIAVYGNLVLALLLGVLSLALILNQQSKAKVYQRHSVASIARFISAEGLPKDLKVQIKCENKQKYILLTSKICTKEPFLIIALPNPEVVNLKRLQQEIKHYQQKGIRLYLVIDAEDEHSDYIKSQLTSVMSIYNIFGSVDHCLEHIRGRLVKLTALPAKL